jgi:hypothetical protein
VITTTYWKYELVLGKAIVADVYYASQINTKIN